MIKHISSGIFAITILAYSFVTDAQPSEEILQWEPDIRRFEHLDSTETYSGDAILFVGSSSIRLWTSLAEDMEPFPIIQRGYGGAKLSDLEYYAERIIYPHECRAVVLFVANDIVGNDADKTPDEVAALAGNILSIIRRKMPSVPVFYIATTPTPLRWEVWPQISAANDKIKAIYNASENACFIETDFAYLDDQRLPRKELFRDDQLHLNGQGYRIWTGIIKAALKKVLGDGD